MTQCEAVPTILKNDDNEAIITVNPSKSAPRPLSHKLSYRFAMDEIDADDIAKVVNDSCDVECIPDGEFNYRKPGPRITAKEIQSDLFDCRCKRRWIVLENPSPDQDVVAAARFLLDIEQKSAVVDLICSIGDDVDTRNWRFCALLKKLESIVRSHSCISVLIEITNWRTDLQELVSSVGYVDSGGRLDESQRSSSFLKQSMLLEYKKEFLPIEKEIEKEIVEKECCEEQPVLDHSESLLCGAVDSVCVTDIGCEIAGEISSEAEAVDGKEVTTESTTESRTETAAETETSSPTVGISESLNNKNEDGKSPTSLGEKLFMETVIDDSGILDSVILTGTKETVVEKPVPVPREGGMEGLMSQLFRALRSENVKPQL